MSQVDAIRWNKHLLHLQLVIGKDVYMLPDLVPLSSAVSIPFALSVPHSGPSRRCYCTDPRSGLIVLG